MPILLRYLKMLGGFVVLWVGIWLFNAFSCQKIESREMEPLLKAESRKLIDPRIRSTDELRHDDLISYTYFTGKSQSIFAARVIGLPGERVRIEAGDVYVNNTKLGSTYVSPGSKSDARENYAEIIVPRDTVYVLCDNRKGFDKYDSRAVGPIGLWAINGKFK